MSIEPVWGAPIVWYLFLAGLGAGAYITSAFLRWRHPEAHGMRRAGHVIAPIVVAIGLMLLMVDAEAGLHNPLRFALLLGNFGSVMTWGVVFLSVFMVIALVTAALDFLKRKVPGWLELAGGIMALCVAAYTGALLGVCQTYPLWNNALLPVLFTVSALSAGAASVLLVASLCFITAFDSTAGFESVMSLVAGEWAVWFWLGLVFVGLILPTVLETWLLFFSSKEFEESRKAHWISFASDAGVLIGGFMLRYLVVMAAVPLTFVM